MPKNATFELEGTYWEAGVGLIAGVDEVGMGALAGPVVGAAVVFDPGVDISGLRDSKKLSAGQREKLAEQIRTVARCFAVGEASVDEIFSLNILEASRLAMRRAVEALAPSPALIFVDGRPTSLHDKIPTMNFIKGDSLVASIAAASILAKVHRDAIMRALDEAFPVYGFAGHKGYGSALHLEALANHGACIHHRAAYAPVARLTRAASSPKI